MMRRPPRSTPVPYTTRFRSHVRDHVGEARQHVEGQAVGVHVEREAAVEQPRARHPGAQRSEEHTSELQSRQYLVCRLLLEKENTGPAPYCLVFAAWSAPPPC